MVHEERRESERGRWLSLSMAAVVVAVLKREATLSGAEGGKYGAVGAKNEKSSMRESEGERGRARESEGPRGGSRHEGGRCASERGETQQGGRRCSEAAKLTREVCDFSTGASGESRGGSAVLAPQPTTSTTTTDSNTQTDRERDYDEATRRVRRGV